MPQRPFMMVPLNCDPCNVAGVLDQLQVDGVWIAHLTIKDGESAEDLTFTRKQGARPNGANTIGLEEVTIVVPKESRGGCRKRTPAPSDRQPCRRMRRWGQQTCARRWQQIQKDSVRLRNGDAYRRHRG